MCNKNAKYTSETTQNELIFECGECCIVIYSH